MQNVCCQKWRLSANIPSKVFNSFSSNHTPNIADDEFWIFKYYSFLPCCYFKRFPIDITNLYRKSNSKQNQSFYSVFGSLAFLCFNSLLVFFVQPFFGFLVMTKILLMSFESCNDVQQTNIKFFTRFLLLVCCLLWNWKYINKQNKKNVMTKQFSFQ